MGEFRRLCGLLLCCWLAVSGYSQERVILEGYAFEENNSGYLNEVKVTVLDAATAMLYGEATTNREGFFALEIPSDRDFLIRATKSVFEAVEVFASSKSLQGDKVYVKIPMPRAPGYLLEVTLSEERKAGEEEVRGIGNSLIEVYNNTTAEEVLVLRDHPTPYFSFQLEQGNHYTLLIRSPGFFSKRIESFVNVDGCILCMDGVSEIGPGVSDNLAYGHEVGMLLANIELKPMKVDSAIALNNIYYDYNKSAIRADAAHELDKVVELLRVNPSIVVELGSHTDSRGRSTYNRELSQLRAQAAVDYILGKGIGKDRLTARGYGEDKPVNVCIDDVECSEAEHARNRRTELRITGFTTDPFDGKPLSEILREEYMESVLAEVLAGGEYRAPESTSVLAEADARRTPNAGIEQLKGDLARDKPAAHPNSPEMVATENSTHRTPTSGLRRPEPRGERSSPVTAADPPNALDANQPPAPVMIEAKAKNSPSAASIPVMVPEQSVTNAAPSKMASGAKISGFRVLVFQSPSSLADDQGSLFFKYGTLREERLADGTFGYMSGVFASESEARSYLADVKGLFPAARLLRYVNGFIIDNAQ